MLRKSVQGAALKGSVFRTNKPRRGGEKVFRALRLRVQCSEQTSPGGAVAGSPRRKPWEKFQPQGRQQVAHGVSRGKSFSPGGAAAGSPRRKPWEKLTTKQPSPEGATEHNQ